MELFEKVTVEIDEEGYDRYFVELNYGGAVVGREQEMRQFIEDAIMEKLQRQSESLALAPPAESATPAYATKERAALEAILATEQSDTTFGFEDKVKAIAREALAPPAESAKGPAPTGRREGEKC